MLVLLNLPISSKKFKKKKSVMSMAKDDLK